MTPEQERQLMAYIQILMSGGDAAGQAGLDLYPTVEKKVGDTNYYQDRLQMLGDPLGGALAGPGAFNMDSFMPTMERTPVDAPGREMARVWASAPENSAVRLMYDLTTAGGMDVNSAWREVANIVEADPGGVTALSLPPDRMDQYNKSIPGSGLRSLYDQALDMQAGLTGDPTGVQYDPMTGTYYQETEVPSALAEEFAAMGLPNPIDQYEEATPDVAWKHLDREGLGYRGDSPADLAGLSAEQAAMNRQLTDWSAGTRALEEEQAALLKESQAATERYQSRQAIDAETAAGDDRGGRAAVLAALEERRQREMNQTRPNEYHWGLETNKQQAEDMRQGAQGIVNDNYNQARKMAGGIMDPWIGALDKVWDPIARRLPDWDPLRRDGGDSDGPSESSKEQDDAMRQAALAKVLAGPGRQNTQRRLQNDIFQGTRDRRKVRMASDPGSQDAINAYAARGAREAGRTPFSDAMRERMLMQQISGF